MNTPLSMWPARGPLQPRRSMAVIASLIGQQHSLTVDDLREGTRAKRIAHPRQEAMAAMHDEGFSHTQIVRFFGLKNHTTSVHAHKVISARRALAQQEAA